MNTNISGLKTFPAFSLKTHINVGSLHECSARMDMVIEDNKSHHYPQDEQLGFLATEPCYQISEKKKKNITRAISFLKILKSPFNS